MTKYLRTLIVCSLILIAVSSVGAELLQGFDASASLNFDSNINPDPNYIEFCVDEGDSAFNIDAGYSISPIVDDMNELGFNIHGGMNSYFEEGDFSWSTISAEVFYRRDEMGPFSFFINYEYSHRSVDNEAYVYSNTLNPTLFWLINENNTLKGRIRARDNTYYNVEALEGLDLGVEIQWILHIDDRQEFSAGIFANENNVDADEFCYTGIKPIFEYSLEFKKDFIFNAALEGGNKHYREDFSSEGEPREESFLYATAELDYNLEGVGFLGKVFVGIVYYQHSSNVDMFDVDRNVISAGYLLDIEF